MRLRREQIELMHEAAQDSAAEEFKLDLTADGKLRFSAVEIVERERPLSLTKLKAAHAKNGRQEERAPAAV